MTTNNQPTHPRRLSKKYLSSEAGQQLIRDIVDCSHTMIDDDLAEMLGIKSHQLTYLRMKLGVKSGGKGSKNTEKNCKNSNTQPVPPPQKIVQTSYHDTETYDRLVATYQSAMEIYNRMMTTFHAEDFETYNSLLVSYQSAVETYNRLLVSYDSRPVRTNNRLLVTYQSGAVEIIPSNQRGLEFIVDNFDSINELTRVTYDDAKWRGDQ